MFERDLVRLKRGFALLSYPEIVSRVMGPSRGRPSAFLSFDDGYAECYSVVRPLLLKHRIPCIFFVTTGFLDNRALFYRNKVSLCIEAARALSKARARSALGRISAVLGLELRSPEGFARWALSLHQAHEPLIDRLCDMLRIDAARYLRSRRPYLTTEQVQTLAADGFTIGAHTLSHPRLDLLTPREAEKEISGSCAAVGALTGAPTVPFAFPFSGDGFDRGLLPGILSRQPRLGLMFDAFPPAVAVRRGGGPAWIIDRMMSDSPSRRWAGRSNILELMRLGFGRRLPARIV